MVQFSKQIFQFYASLETTITPIICTHIIKETLHFTKKNPVHNELKSEHMAARNNNHNALNTNWDAIPSDYK